jgi:hypothetical protein
MESSFEETVLDEQPALSTPMPSELQLMMFSEKSTASDASLPREPTEVSTGSFSIGWIDMGSERTSFRTISINNVAFDGCLQCDRELSTIRYPPSRSLKWMNSSITNFESGRAMR